MMIFVLIVVLSDFFARVFEIFLKFSHPFGDNSENCVRLDKEDAIIDLCLTVRRRIFMDLFPNNILGVSLYLVSVLQIIGS